MVLDVFGVESAKALWDVVRGQVAAGIVERRSRGGCAEGRRQVYFDSFGLKSANETFATVSYGAGSRLSGELPATGTQLTHSLNAFGYPTTQSSIRSKRGFGYPSRVIAPRLIIRSLSPFSNVFTKYGCP